MENAWIIYFVLSLIVIINKPSGLRKGNFFLYIRRVSKLCQCILIDMSKTRAGTIVSLTQNTRHSYYTD